MNPLAQAAFVAGITGLIVGGLTASATLWAVNKQIGEARKQAVYQRLVEACTLAYQRSAETFLKASDLMDAGLSPETRAAAFQLSQSYRRESTAATVGLHLFSGWTELFAAHEALHSSIVSLLKQMGPTPDAGPSIDAAIDIASTHLSHFGTTARKALERYLEKGAF